MEKKEFDFIIISRIKGAIKKPKFDNKNKALQSFNFF